jgi:hypothetical protein
MRLAKRLSLGAVTAAGGFGEGGGSSEPTPVSRLLFNGPDASTTFTDEAGVVWTPQGTARLDTAQSFEGGSSFELNGGFIVSASSPAFAFGGGDFTIRMKVRPALIGDNYCILDTRGGGNGFALYLSASGYGGLVTVFDHSAGIVWGGTLATGVWSDLAFVRDGNTLRLYINGVQTGSAATSKTFNADTSTCYVGANYVSGQAAGGHLDRLEVYHECLYPDGTTFTPP